MKKLIVLLGLICLLSACEKPIIDEITNLYEGEIHFFDAENVTSLSVQIKYFNDAIFSYNDQGELEITNEEKKAYIYGTDDMHVVVYPNENNEYVGISYEESYILGDMDALYSDMDQLVEDLSLFIQEDYTNVFTYANENKFYRVLVNEDNYITEIKYTDLTTGDVLLRLFDINSTVVDVPEHIVFSAQAYVMMTLYPEVEYTIVDNFLTIENSNWEAVINHNGFTVYFSNENDSWRYYDFVSQFVRDSDGNDIDIEDFLLDQDTLFIEFFEQITDIQYYIKHIDELFYDLITWEE